MSYDVIGDIHGHAAKLKALLARMGYRDSGGSWRHPQRQAVFVGDFVDRGPAQVETVELVRRMVESGAALATMGNHEFNAIAWYTPDPRQPGEYLRPRLGPTGARNLEQHRRFLVEVEGRPEHRRIIDWFKTLPLWLDLPGLRVVHACWHDRYMAWLRSRLGAGNTLTDELVATSSYKGDPAYDAVETLLKGIEVGLPEGGHFQDKGGMRRERVRVRWWGASPTTFHDAALSVPDGVAIPPLPLPESSRVLYGGDKPVVFGHYWMTGTPRVFSEKIACVDYSAGKGGPLVAYRWDGETVLSDANFASSG